MQTKKPAFLREIVFSATVLITLIFSLVVLRSIAPFLFPSYFFYIAISIFAFWLFSKIDIDILSLFSKHLYIISIFFLILPIFLGQITRGTVRWINLGPSTIQPSEIVRPFIFVFFANYIARKNLDFKTFLKSLVLFLVPFFLILFQPSLGVAIITAVGFFGILLSADFDKKRIFLVLLSLFLVIPLGWKMLAPYQKERVVTFVNPQVDPLGAGYNSIQSMIAVGSGKLWGRGLGKGVQTQLAFLPERHTDFVFASISEEMGFVGSLMVFLCLFVILFKLSSYVGVSKNPQARAFISAIFLILLVQTTVHIGMNMGLLPITGVPLPLISAGGSSLLGTMIGLGIVLGSIKN